MKLLNLISLAIVAAAASQSTHDVTTPDYNTYGSTDSISLGTGNTTPPVEYIENKIARWSYLYGGGIVFILGGLGNVMTMAVLWRTFHRSGDAANNTGIYLFVLAAVDLFMLTLGQPLRHWTRAMSGVDLTNLTRWGCRVYWFIMSLISIYVNYILAGVSLERCLAVLSPLKSRRYLTRKSAVLYLLVILTINAGYVMYSFVFFDLKFYNVNGKRIQVCTSLSSSYFVAKVRPWTDFTVRTIIPGTVIVLSNFCIIRAVIQASRKRLTGLTQQSGQSTKEAHDNTFWSLTFMLVTISIAFVVIMTPVHVIYIMSVVFPDEPGQTSHEAAVTNLKWAAVVMLSYLSNAMNFYLYVVSGKHFRKELWRMLQGIFCRDGKGYGKKNGDFSMQTKSTIMSST